MSKINEQIERLRGVIRKCYAAVTEKNGIVPEIGERTMTNLPDAIASTHDTLEELTITENGTYTPQEGVDGFRKVVAKVVSTNRVVIPRIQVTKNQIIDGYWAGELVDTSTMTTTVNMFYGCDQLQNIDVSNWDTSNVTNMNNMFRDCFLLQNINVKNWDVSKVTDMHQMFNVCRQFTSIDVSNWNVSNVTNIYAMFYYCGKLKNIDLSNWNVSKVTDTHDMFTKCYQLQSLIGNLTIDDVLANNIGALNGLKVALSLKYTILDRASIRALINGLADLTGKTPQTLTIGAKLMEKLTEEDIAIATNKNWTLS